MTFDIKRLETDFDKNLIDIDCDPKWGHLKSFLNESEVNDYIREKFSAVYWLFIDWYIRWYITLSVSTIKFSTDDWMGWFARYDWPPIPWLLIWKLLVDSKMERWWHGSNLIAYATSIAVELSKIVWMRFIIVDSHKDSVGFYEKKWFIKVEWTWNNDTIKMVLDISYAI